MGRRLQETQLLHCLPKNSCGVTVTTTALKIQPTIHAGKEATQNQHMCISLI